VDQHLLFSEKNWEKDKHKSMMCVLCMHTLGGTCQAFTMSNKEKLIIIILQAFSNLVRQSFDFIV